MTNNRFDTSKMEVESNGYGILSMQWCKRLGIEPLSLNVLVQPREVRMWFLRAFATARNSHVSDRAALCKAFNIEDDRQDAWGRVCKENGDAATPLQALLNPQKAKGVVIKVQGVQPVAGPLFPMYKAESVTVHNEYTWQHVVTAYRQAAASLK